MGERPFLYTSLNTQAPRMALVHLPRDLDVYPKMLSFVAEWIYPLWILVRGKWACLNHIGISCPRWSWPLVNHLAPPKSSTFGSRGEWWWKMGMLFVFVSGFLYLYLISTIIHAMNLHGRKPHQTWTMELFQWVWEMVPSDKVLQPPRIPKLPVDVIAPLWI